VELHTAVAVVVAGIRKILLVALWARFGLFGPAQLALSPQQTQVFYEYAISRWFYYGEPNYANNFFSARRLDT
jgi:hypothetical protein